MMQGPMPFRGTAATFLAITFTVIPASWADDEAREAAIQLGSQTAKGGFQNEEDVCDRFNRWQTDAVAREWLAIMHGQLDGIETVTATIPRGAKAKTDVEVRVTTAEGETRYGISIKLVSNAGGFNQIDKRWLDSYATMWNMPPDVHDALKLFVGEVPPTGLGKDPDRMFLTELPPDTQRAIVAFFEGHRATIVSDLLGGDGPHAAGWFLVTVRGDHAQANRWVLISTASAARFFNEGEVVITPAGSLKIGRITMQRKGGDNGRETATMLQFKIDPTDLFDRAESGSLDPVSRQVVKPDPNVVEDSSGTGE